MLLNTVLLLPLLLAVVSAEHHIDRSAIQAQERELVRKWGRPVSSAISSDRSNSPKVKVSIRKIRPFDGKDDTLPTVSTDHVMRLLTKVLRHILQVWSLLLICRIHSA